MANQYLTSSLLTKAAVQNFKVANTFVETGNREYEGMYTQQTWEPGETVNVRLDNRYRSQRGNTVTSDDIIDRKLSMTIQPLVSIPINYKPTDLQREIKDFNSRFLMPATRTAIATINSELARFASEQLYMHNGTPGQNLDSYAKVDDTYADMEEVGIPMDEALYWALKPAQGAKLRQSLSNQFNQPLNTGILRRASLGELDGFDFYSDQAIYTHTAGAAAGGGGITVKTTVTSGTNQITLTGLTASQTGALVAGDKLTFGTVFRMNPVLHTATTQAFQCVVLPDAAGNTSYDSDSNGDVTILVSPTIISDANNALQNVSGSLAAGTTVSIAASHSVNPAYCTNSLVCAFPRLAPMDSPDSAVHTDTESGLSIRISKDANVLDNENILRLDVQFAAVWLPETAFAYLT